MPGKTTIAPKPNVANATMFISISSSSTSAFFCVIFNRKLGLKHALSAKATAGELIVIDTVEAKTSKTADLAKVVTNLGWKKVLIIDGTDVNENFLLASRNIDGLDVLPSAGANVYDILKSNTLVLTKAGAEALEARLK